MAWRLIFSTNFFCATKLKNPSKWISLQLPIEISDLEGEHIVLIARFFSQYFAVFYMAVENLNHFQKTAF